MKYTLAFLLCLVFFSAVSQDRIELGYQTTKRGVVWYRNSLPTHKPAWRLSRDTNAVMWVDTFTTLRYDWSYKDDVWYTKGTSISALPPLPTQSSGSATIDNRQSFWRPASNTLHRYDHTQTAWVPLKMSYQSAAPANIASGGGNGAAVYTTSLWQDSDDFVVYYWDGAAWAPISGGTGTTNLTFSGTTSPVTLNSSTGTDVTITQGTGISLTATGSNMNIINSAPDQTVTLTGAGITVITGTYPAFTITSTEVDGSITNELQTLSVASNTATLSGAGGSVTIAGAGINVATTAGTTITVTGTEIDGSITNEGLLGVGAGSGTSSILLSNTSTAAGVTINAAGILAITESTSANGGTITLTATEGFLGTVTSVGLSLPSIFTVSGSPVTSSGTLTGTLATQLANTVFAGPTAGGAATPAFRALVAADIPSLPYAPTLSVVSGQVTYANSSTTITTEAGSGVNSLAWDATNNRLGVGTTSPAQPLHVTGNIQGTADIYLGADFKMYDNGVLYLHKTGTRNLFIGVGSGNLTTTSSDNYAIGRNTLAGVLTGASSNLAFGDQALKNCTNCLSNVGLGTNTGFAITTGSYNMLLGRSAGEAITTGSQNVAVGFLSLNGVTTADDNVAIGNGAMGGNAASRAVAIGSGSSSTATARDKDIDMGYGAGQSATGTQSIRIGYFAGAVSSASNSIFLGYATGYTNTVSDALSIDWNTGFATNKAPLISGKFNTKLAGVNTTHANLAAAWHVTGTGTTSGSWAAQFHNSTGSNNGLMIRDDGKVGVGTNAPAQTLDVVGTLRVSTGTGTANALWGKNASGDFSAVTVSTGLLLSGNALTAMGTIGGSGTINYVPYWVTSTTLGDSYFYVNGAAVMSLGSSSVGKRLQIFNDYASTSAAGSADFANLVLTNRNATNGNWSVIEFDASGAGIAADFGAHYVSHAGQTADLVFHTRGATTSFGQAMVISSEKLVGIGVDPPTQRLHVAGSARVTGAYYDSANSPGTSGQVLTSGATTTAWAAATAVGAILTLNNGLTLTGTVGQWGGTLIQNTTLDGNTFYTLHKDGRQITQRYESNPVTTQNVLAAVDHTGIALAPGNSTPAEDAILNLRGYTDGTSTYAPNMLSMGIYPITADGAWIQTRNNGSYASTYPIGINPRGGRFSVGRVESVNATEALVTLSGSGLTASTAAGSVLQIEAQESTSARIGYSATVDGYNAGTGWYNSALALRHYAMTTTTGTVVSFGFTETPTELVIQRNASGTSNVGVGVSTFADIDSRLQIGGSFAFPAETSSAATLTLGDADCTVFYTGTAAATYTIPAASGVVGRYYWINNESNFTITLSQTVTRYGGTFTTVTAGQSVLLVATTSGGWHAIKVASL